MEHQINKLREAVEKGELFEYMVGENGYEYVSRDADVPTEDQVVFASIVALYRETKDDSIWKYFQATWLAISTDATYSWLSLYYLYHCVNYITQPESYHIDIKGILPSIIDNLKKNKKYLSKNKRWVGSNYSDGLWGDAKRMINNLNTNYNLGIYL
jgi:hypothetical protein